ncbi:hypothetical protein [Amycolatopsis lexingtonensis]|uniref:hypothetical protein n=1 Tax=Amycolatopsis lexingtonensis TaxID=218822 RepID=UPI003F7202D5
MDIAAFVISVLAMIASGGSALYARRQAKAGEVQAEAASAQARIEGERRHRELTPELVAEVENRGGWYRLRLDIGKSQPLTRIEAHILEGVGVQFRQGIDGVPPQHDVPVQDAYYLPEFNSPGKAELVEGEAAFWVLELEDERGDNLRLQCKCVSSSGEIWTVVSNAQLPPRPSKIW